MVKVIGLTSSIAGGKSTVTQYLLSHGYQVLDADKIAHLAYLDKACYEKIVNLFDCLDEKKNIDRKKLGRIVFQDAIKKQQLEAIIHPFVIESMNKGIKQCQDDLIFLDIPLLFESHLEAMCDKIIVVYVDEDTQIKRLMKRNRISREDALHLMQQQLSLEKKKDMGDYIINNNQNFAELYKDIERVIGRIKNEVIHE